MRLLGKLLDVCNAVNTAATLRRPILNICEPKSNAPLPSSSEVSYMYRHSREPRVQPLLHVLGRHIRQITTGATGPARGVMSRGVPSNRVLSTTLASANIVDQLDGLMYGNRWKDYAQAFQWIAIRCYRLSVI